MVAVNACAHSEHAQAIECDFKPGSVREIYKSRHEVIPPSNSRQLFDFPSTNENREIL
jgi:hypothetical protein